MDYLARRRHLLVDMHVPDWNPAFLAKLDPSAMGEFYQKAGVDAVMLYCNSHAGECFYPTASGHFHSGLAGVDFVGASVADLHRRGIAVCAYYSCNFNNRAYHDHPEWRLKPANPNGYYVAPNGKYGICCPANRDYLAYAQAQVTEIMAGYPFDALFLDMIHWPEVCVCDACATRFQSEHGDQIPRVVDWASPTWTAFQEARQRWLLEEFRLLKATAKRAREVPVFCNAAGLDYGWIGGASEALLLANDILGGDFNEGRDALYPAALYLSSLGPLQVMNTFSEYGGSTSNLRDRHAALRNARAADAFDAQVLVIEAIDPDGSINAAVAPVIEATFNEVTQERRSGAPWAELAVLWSVRSCTSHQGAPLETVRMSPAGPHQAAVEGAVEALRRDGFPVAVIGERDLSELSGWAVLVLPQVDRLTPFEIDAVRRYVAGGGRLYVSGTTSLLTADGVAHPDFLLGDVLGIRRVGEVSASVLYLNPVKPAVAALIDPVRRLAIGEPSTMGRSRAVTKLCPLVEASSTSRVLATLTRAYGEGPPSLDNQEWASIHTNVPFRDTAHPLLVMNDFGQGRALYSAIALEDVSDNAASTRSTLQRLFAGLLRLLLERPPRVEVKGHPDVWPVVRQVAATGALTVTLHNHSASLPQLPIPKVAICVDGRELEVRDLLANQTVEVKP